MTQRGVQRLYSGCDRRCQLKHGRGPAPGNVKDHDRLAAGGGMGFDRTGGRPRPPLPRFWGVRPTSRIARPGKLDDEARHGIAQRIDRRHFGLRMPRLPCTDRSVIDKPVGQYSDTHTMCVRRATSQGRIQVHAATHWDPTCKLFPNTNGSSHPWYAAREPKPSKRYTCKSPTPPPPPPYRPQAPGKAPTGHPPSKCQWK